MKRYKILAFAICQLFIVVRLSAQENNAEFFVATSGELPTFNLNQTNIISQQYNFALGYAFPKSGELFLNIGIGMLGNDSEDLNFVLQGNSYGVGANYLFPIKPHLTLGLEVLAAYGSFSIPEDVNYDHALYQAAIKIQTPAFAVGKVYGMVGIRYRSFFDYTSMNSLEYYTGIGMRFGFARKAK